MATIALPRAIHQHHSPSPMAPLTPVLSLEHISTSAACALPIPNKHLPVCPPGPVPSVQPDTPPASPPSKNVELQNSTALFPPDDYEILPGSSNVYAINATEISAALDDLSTQALPDPTLVFPWLHGLHPQNHIQQQFFIPRRRSLRRTPQCVRSIAIIKSGSDLSRCRLKGAIAPEEIFQYNEHGEATFADIDPKEGFNVRNFQIQTAKWAFLSDIIVYGDADRSSIQVRELAEQIAGAQKAWREKNRRQGNVIPTYNTFVCTSEWQDFEERYPEIVATDAMGLLTGQVMDFLHQERVEMCEMTRASKIAHNVWLGPTPDSSIDPAILEQVESQYDIFIECNDLGRIDPKILEIISESPDDKPAYLEFPSSGSMIPSSWHDAEVDDIVEYCKGLYALTHGHRYIAHTESHLDKDGDSPMPDEISSPAPQRILIHCTDGYTESTMLALCYFVFSTGLPLHAAWLSMHTEKKRNFFAYPSDVALLQLLTPRLQAASPVHPSNVASAPATLTSDAGRILHHRCTSSTSLPQEITSSTWGSAPQWLRTLDGSLPSRILPHLYLGNLHHANSPALLKALGITKILSVGEMYSWPEGTEEAWGQENICVVGGVQDNGVDSLTGEFERCLDFIEQGRLNNTATLVHCRVGVSRSATICIASVMRSLEISFGKAYCFVRARRLNVIIQPHLRFSYELLKWEEQEGRRWKGGDGMWKRELEWGEITREIAGLNRPYSR